MELRINKSNGMAVCFIVGVLLALLFGCSAEEKHAGSTEKQEPYAMVEGERLYLHYCAICHGENGDGSGRYYGSGMQASPADFTQESFFRERSDNRLYTAISEGSASVGKSNLCPPWGRTLHKEEIEFLIGYIKSFVQQEADEAEDDRGL
ncbi:MAG: c-type cytochrome [Chlorobium phaeobacteroides]|nr:c-type cytochrome [Chlorobium phaeobacteroides]